MPTVQYLSTSRHGVFYFRWPITDFATNKRRSIRLSLKTRCAKQAGKLARYLRVQGERLEGHPTLVRMRLDEQRALVKSYFERSLEFNKRRIDDEGLPKRRRTAMENNIGAYEDAEREDGCDKLAKEMLGPSFEQRFRERAGVSDADWEDNAASFRENLRRAHRDMLNKVIAYADQLKHFDFGDEPKPTAPAASIEERSGLSLGGSIAAFMEEYTIGRSQEMIGKVTKSLDILLEMFGPARSIAIISRQDVSEVRKVLQAYPKARNTNPKTKGLPLKEALEAEGVDAISLKTANGHIENMRLLWAWAKLMGHVPEDLFEGMKFRIAKGAAVESERDAFTPEQSQLLLEALVNYSTGRPAQKEKDLDRKWASLIALFTGARRTEIGQLYVEDVKQDDKTGIWFIDFNDNGPDKSLKSGAAHRQVPLHSQLIELGLLDFVNARRQNGLQKLFTSFTFHKKDGCGKNFGRFFNETLLPSLGLKEKGLVLHSCRHTIVHRLVNAGVQQAVCQAIVGHEREGVTEKNYNKRGYSLEICKEAIEKYSIS